MTHLSERSALPTVLFHLARTSAAWISYRHRLRARLMRALPPPLLRVLSDLPLPVTDTLTERPGTAVHWLRSGDIGALCERSRVPLALVGPPGSGRSLVLAQIAWRWVAASTIIPPLWFNIAQNDTPDHLPHTVMSAMLRDAGEMHVSDRSIETHRPWLLLLTGWEELPQQRRCEWLDFLHDLPRTWPDAQLCIALPDEATRQNSFPRSMPLTMRSPDDELTKRMLDAFLPRTKRDSLMAKLVSEGELAPLRKHAVDLIFLAWMYEEGGTPADREALWAWAIKRWGSSGTAADNSWLRDHQITRHYLAAHRQKATVESSSQDNRPASNNSDASFFESAPPEPGAIANLRQLSAALLVEGATHEKQRATLDAIGTSTAPGVGMLLVRCALMHELPIWLRLHAVKLLATRRGALALLGRILEAPAAPDLLRAQVVEVLAAHPANSVTSSMFVSALQNSSFPLTQRAAAHALSTSEPSAVATHALVTLLDEQAESFDLREACIVGLGHQGGSAAVPQLARWLGNSACERLRNDWNNLRNELTAPLSESWPQAKLSSERRQDIATFFAQCAVTANQPTTLDELLAQWAERISATAASTLARVGGAQALESLCNALQNASETYVPALLEAINTLDTSGETLTELIGRPALQGRARWLTVQALPAAFPANFERLLLSLKDDPFARGALAQALTNSPVDTSLPLLLRLIEDAHEQLYVRAQALVALGAVGGPQAEALLLGMIGDSSLPPMMRTAAAQALPTPLSAQGCALLRKLVQDPSLNSELLVGMLVALGKTKDNAALSWALHLCKHDSPDVALAAIQAVQRIGDPVALPLLKGIAQSIRTTPPVRVQAAGAMLHLSSAEGFSLLAPVFDGAVLPLQLQALDLLANAQPDSPLIAAVLRDRQRALPLRQRAAQAIAASSPSMLWTLLADPDERPAMRLHLIDLLFASICSTDDAARSDMTSFMSTLTALAYESSLPHNLRWRVLRTLAAFGQQAEPILSDLLYETQGDPSVRRWAADYLQHITSNRATGDAS